MAAVMRNQRKTIAGILLPALLLTAFSVNLPASEEEQGTSRLQELLYGEALFHSHQQDYLAAISRLQLAETEGLLPPSADDARLLLARMKLAYGLHLEASFDLHALLDEEVPAAVRNRTWYELARAFSRKAYYQAAAETLTYIRGEVPDDIAGDLQLLRATVLMSLNRDLEAAQVLEQWQGAPELAAYAHYNRGIALVRAGEHQRAVNALEMAVETPARGEELLALRDKSRLALGYTLARQENYQRASKQLKRVRPQGPFSNRALLALGWIAYKEGRSDSALASWMELRDRSPTDPAVLETLLVVPGVHRERDAMHTATRDYEAAVAAYSNELRQLHAARESVQAGLALPLLLQGETGPARDPEGQARREAMRFFGPLLARRGFSEMQQGHDELHTMLDQVDSGLREIDSLASSATPGDQGTLDARPPVAVESAAGEPASSQAPQPGAGPTGDPQSQRQWMQRQGQPTRHPAPKIPQLPEVESPADRALKPFPERHTTSRPPVSGFFSTLPSPEFIRLPGAGEFIRRPESGEFFGKPQSGAFFRRPGEEEEEDYAYPDLVPQQRTTPGESYAYQLNRLLPADEEEPGFNSGAVPVGEALRELAAALNKATRRMAELDSSFDPAMGAAGPGELIAALRARILKLRARIANAIVLYENYTQALALDELDRRQLLLEDLLEQASLELAKTYDQSSDR
jgi:tetratricopeptide (TPR) repeat protein